MKYLSIIFLSSFFILTSQSIAQFDILDKIKEKIENKAEEEIDEQIDETIDGAFEGENEDQAEPEAAEGDESELPEQKPAPAGKSSAGKESLKSYSKFDFIPGEKVIYYTDFSHVEAGDFPAEWNTNASAEVVTLNNYPGKWFKFGTNAIYELELPADLPDNFTIEFDMVQQFEPGNFGECNLEFFESLPDESFDFYVAGKGGGAVAFMPYVIRYWNWMNKEHGNIHNDLETSLVDDNNNNVIHFSGWKQKERFRLYAGEAKIIDVQKFFDKSLKINIVRFTSNVAADGSQNTMISNIRIAAGAPDTRSKLITEGKLVTRGILFDSGSDKIKPESYGTLKDIAVVLKDNPDVKVKIIGHTDSDGDDSKNLDLSKRRSNSVKNALAQEFGIETSRMETDGKGEAEPASPNNTSEGKANNRRVEFIKL